MQVINTKQGPIAWMASNPVAANILMVLLLMGGVLATKSIRQEVFPSFDTDIVTISIVYPGTSPKEVEEGVVLPVEEAVRDINNVKKVTSTASEGVGTVTVEFLSGTDTTRALSDVKNAVDRLRSLPEEAERPNVSLVVPQREVINIIIHGDLDQHALKAVGEKARDELLNKADITVVKLSGIPSIEISLEVPHQKLREFDLTLDQIAQKVRSSSRDISAGGVKAKNGEILLRVQERRDEGREFFDIPIISRPDGSIVRLGEIANIVDGFSKTDEAAYYNGQPAVMLLIYREGNQTPIEVSEAAWNYVHDLEAELPESVQVTAFNDRAEYYRDRIKLLIKNAYLGLILVVLLLGIFLDIKLAFWVTLGIPISFLGAIFFLPAFDVSINMVSLFAFIMALGMVVDDAIVVGENVYTKRRKGMPYLQAAIEGAQEIAVPVTFSIITNIVAFVPLLYIQGIMGKIMRVIPIVIILAFRSVSHQGSQHLAVQSVRNIAGSPKRK